MRHNGKDRRLIDVSELERVYGELKTPEQSGKGSENTAETIIDTSQNVSLTNNDNQKKIAVLETQVQGIERPDHCGKGRKNEAPGFSRPTAKTK